MKHSYSVTQAWFGEGAYHRKCFRSVGLRWRLDKDETAIPRGAFGIASLSGQPYVWTQDVEGSEYDNELCALLGLVGLKT